LPRDVSGQLLRYRQQVTVVQILRRLSEAVEPPRLTAGPGARVGDPLMGPDEHDPPAGAVEVNRLKRRAVGPHEQ